MSELRSLLERYVSMDSNVEERLQRITVEALETRITDEIVQQEAERINELSAKLKKEADEREANANLSKRIRAASRAFRTVVLIGLLVGLAGNQLTDLITMLKEYSTCEISVLKSTVLTAGLILFIIFVLYKIEYVDQASEMIEKFIRKGEYESND